MYRFSSLRRFFLIGKGMKETTKTVPLIAVFLLLLVFASNKCATNNFNCLTWQRLTHRRIILFMLGTVIWCDTQMWMFIQELFFLSNACASLGMIPNHSYPRLISNLECSSLGGFHLHVWLNYYDCIMTVGAISQWLLERNELQAKIPNSISKWMATLYVSTSYLKTASSLLLQPTPGVAFNRSCASAICSRLGDCRVPVEINSSYHHRQLLVWCFLLFLPTFFNLQPGWANSGMETKKMFAFFLPCVINSENAASSACPNSQHSSKYGLQPLPEPNSCWLPELRWDKTV